MYTKLVEVEVGIRELRARLSHWIDRVQAGDEVIVTERGRPVARLSAVGARSRLEELIAQGRVTAAKASRTPIERDKLPKMPPGKTLSDYVLEERRSRDR